MVEGRGGEFPLGRGSALTIGAFEVDRGFHPQSLLHAIAAGGEQFLAAVGVGLGDAVVGGGASAAAEKTIADTAGAEIVHVSNPADHLVGGDGGGERLEFLGVGPVGAAKILKNQPDNCWAPPPT